ADVRRRTRTCRGTPRPGASARSRSRETVLVRCWLVKRKRGDHQQLSHLGKASSDHVPRTRVGDRYGGPPVLEPREARRRRAGASRATRTPSIRDLTLPPPPHPGRPAAASVGPATKGK